MLKHTENQILETFGKLIPILSEAQKNYLLGLGEGMVIMEENRQMKPNGEEERKICVDDTNTTN